MEFNLNLVLFALGYASGFASAYLLVYYLIRKYGPKK